LTQEAYRPIEDIPAEKGLPTLAEYAVANDGPLLRVEWAVLCRKAHLTYQQNRALWWYKVEGLSLTATAQVMECEVRTVRAHIAAAASRVSHLPNIGLLTVLIETFGLRDVMDALQE